MKGRCRGFLCSAISAAMVVGLMPSAAMAASAAGSAADKANAPAEIEGTAGVDYVDGEVIVAVRGGKAALDAETDTGWVARALGQSANKAGGSSVEVGEELAAVSADDIDNAAADKGTAGEVDTSGIEDKSSDDIEIVQLSVDDTAQAIADLQGLDCVVAAQPNYIYQQIDDESSDEQSIDTATSAAKSASGTEASSANASKPTSATAAATSTTATQTASASGNAAGGESEPFFADQWSLQNSTTLQANGYTSDTTSLNVQDAWTAGAGDETGGEVVVAVIDSGVDYTHEDLVDNMWTGGNAEWSKALGGGTYGYNALADSDSTDPMDASSGHGTHCASTIAGTWNNTGIAGVNNKAKIMAVRAIATASETATSASTMLSYNYVITAKENNVNVVACSNSWGSGAAAASSDTLLDSLIYKAGKEGIVSVFAAGNSDYDNDLNSGYGYESSNPYLLQVGAIDSTGKSSAFSQWGKRSVDVYSPGTRVLAATSTYGDNHDSSVGMEGQYLPWLSGSAGANSTYFMDTAEDTTAPENITYDLIAFDKTTHETTKEVDNVRDTSALGYASAKSLKFSLNQTDASGNQIFDDRDNIAIRVNIPAATWQSYKDQAAAKGIDDLYFSGIGGISGLVSSTVVVPYANMNSSWGFVGGGNAYVNHSWDANWYSYSAKTSVSALENGADAQGNMHLLLWVYRLGYAEGETSFTCNDYVYLDNISLGYAAGTENDEGQIDDTYYYSDGTSMATPNVSGVVSLLSSHSKVKGETLQGADTAKKIVSFIKGGVTQLSSISDKCKTGGVANADASYEAYAAYLNGTSTATVSLHPVSDVIVDNGDGTLTLKGSFFGSTKGTVTFDGTPLDVTSWTDSAITFTGNPYGKEYTGKIVVTKGSGEDAVTGQNYLTMPKGSKAAGSFSSLPTPDFDIVLSNLDDTGVSLTANANQTMVAKMVSAGGYLYVLGTVGNYSVPVLMRYDVAKDQWDNASGNLLAGVKTDQSLPMQMSMAAGMSEIYMKIASDSDVRLITVNVATGKISYDFSLGNNTPNANGSIVSYNGELLLVGGAEGEPVYSAIYPDTGTVYRQSKATLDTAAYYGTASVVSLGEDATEICLTGTYNQMDAVTNGAPGGINQEIEITLDENKEPTLTTSTSRLFFDANGVSDCSLDAGQAFGNTAAAAADSTILVTGPVHNNEQSTMADTYIYNTVTKKWTIAEGVRFAPESLAYAAACVCNGSYYVIGLDRSLDQTTANQYLRFGSYALSKFGKTSTLTEATATDAAKAPDLSDATVKVASATYTGSALTPAVTVTLGDKTLTADTDYTLSYSDNVEAGTGKVTLEANGTTCTGTRTVEFAIAKAAQSGEAKTVARKVSFNKLLLAKSVVKGVEIANCQGDAVVTYKKAQGSKCLKVDKETGKVTVKRWTKRGTYKVKVSVSFDATANYNASVCYAWVKVRVR